MEFIAWDTLKYGEKRRMLEGFRRANIDRKGDLFSAFDIETSAIHPFTDWDDCPPSICYIWQFHVEGFNPIYGRHLNTFVDEILTQLRNRYTFHCAVHNLSFEAQFLRPYIKDYVSKRRGKYDVFMRDPRTFQNITVNGAKLFCTSILSGKPLAQFMRDNNVPAEYQKLDGDDFDYRAIRTPETELTDNQLLYCRNDVMGLVEACRRLADATGYTANTIPQTSTGFVREDVKRVTSHGAKKWRADNDFNPFYMSDAIAWLFRKAFRGGNTHANRAHIAEWINDVGSYDRTSSYPAVLLSYKFPKRLTGFYFDAMQADVGDYASEVCDFIAKSKAHVLSSETIGEALHRTFDPLRDDTYLYHVVLNGVHIKDGFPVPYIPASGSDKLELSVNWYTSTPKHLQVDNGRVLHAESVDMWLCEGDLSIIMGEYNVESVDVKAALQFETEFLPQSFRDLVKEYFYKKCTLKDGTIEYQQIKGRFNALYGMFACDPFGVDFEFCNDFGESPAKLAPRECIGDRQLMPYQIGVYTPMLARWELERGIKCFDGVSEGAGSPLQFIYTDTDSIKYTGETPDMLLRLIDELRATAEENGVKVTRSNGKEKYLGSWDYEGRYRALCTLGAKKYCAENEDGSYTITVAGVNKKTGSASIKSREDFTKGKIFDGKLVPKYFDDEFECSETLCQVDYKLDITDGFNAMLDFYEQFGDSGIFNACVRADAVKGDKIYEV